MFRREIRFRPAFDKRTNDPKTNCGIHGADLAFYLHGQKGVIQFVVFTGWHLPHVQAELDAKRPDGQFPYLFHKPQPADIGYHSRKPMYEGQKPMGYECEFLGGECYYDGSSLQAEEVFNILIKGGDAAVWNEMERRYHGMFTEEVTA